MKKESIFKYNLVKKLFGEDVELLPSVTELFELELAFLEFNSLEINELIRRSAYFKSINSQYTLHYKMNTFQPSQEIQSRSNMTKNYFQNGLFSTGYATHSLFPYRGKFHPQLVKCLLNIIGIRKGDLILDPMCGSGTTNIEAAILGINSVAVDISPFCRLMTKIKYESLKLNKKKLLMLKGNNNILFNFFINKRKYDKEKHEQIFGSEFKYYFTLLVFLDSMGYYNRIKKTTHDVLFNRVLDRYINTIMNYIENPFYDRTNLGNVKISKESSALKMKFQDNYFDGIITSPPYSFAIDYVKNDKYQLEYLGLDTSKLKNHMIGLKGKNKVERLENYFSDMKMVCFEISRVLKPNKYAVIIIGSNTNQTGGIRLEGRIINYFKEANLELVKKILKPIKGLRNTMKDEYILFFRKKEGK